MRFEDAYEGWTEKRLTQIDAARLLSDPSGPLGRPLSILTFDD